MMHDFHDELPGFDERQILKDGCEECAARAKDLRLAILSLDRENFARAWERAAAFERDEDVGRVSEAERPLLSVLWAVQVQLQRRGVPNGTVPGRGSL